MAPKHPAKRISGLLTLIKNGCLALYNGDYGRIFSYLEQKYNTDQNIHAKSLEQKVSKVNKDVNIIRIKCGETYNYHRVVCGEEFTYEVDSNVSSINFNIVDLRDTTTISVICDFHTNNGTISKKFEYFDDEYYELNKIPVEFTLDDDPYVKKFTVEVKSDMPEPGSESFVPNEWNSKPAYPLVSLPRVDTVGNKDEMPNVFLITIDTFRHDYLSDFDSTISALGNDVRIPSHPQTQGVCTWPAHASMFTGVHPGTHKSQANESSIFDGTLLTIPEILEEEGYICSACVPVKQTSPDYGFGKGFDRFLLRPMSWKAREYDATTNVEQIIDWLEIDYQRNQPAFYFLHLFDAHYPYYPPLSDVQLEEIDFGLIKRIPHPGDFRNYMELIKNNPIKLADRDLHLMKEYYSLSLQYVDTQVSRLISKLKELDEFDNSLIIITGDHGEDFLEHNFLYHHSLYEANIRPGMIIKPPSNSDLKIPDEADTIDFLPTLASLVGQEQPVQCVGQSWMQKRESTPRITERFIEHYNISVESQGYKSILTYEKNGSKRPTRDQLKSGPIFEEFFVVDDNERLTNIPNDKKDMLRQVVYDFIDKNDSNREYSEVTLSEDAKERLEELGYK